MSATINPLGNRVIVKRKEATQSKGGILLPESAQEKPKQGEVIAVGPGRVDDRGALHPMDVKPGDQILFSSYAGTEYKSQDTEYLILSQDDILAVMES